MDPREVVENQITAFNSQELDRLFDSIYSPSMEVFDLKSNNKRIFEDLGELKSHLEKAFKDDPPFLENTWVGKIGNVVSVHERKSYPKNPSKKSIEMFAIYEITDGKISKIWIA